MTKYSRYEHSHSSEAPIVYPSPTELEADIDSLLYKTGTGIIEYNIDEVIYININNKSIYDNDNNFNIYFAAWDDDTIGILYDNYEQYDINDDSLLKYSIASYNINYIKNINIDEGDNSIYYNFVGDNENLKGTLTMESEIINNNLQIYSTEDPLEV